VEDGLRRLYRRAAGHKSLLATYLSVTTRGYRQTLIILVDLNVYMNVVGDGNVHVAVAVNDHDYEFDDTS
jgi:hypothetical protein